MPPCLRAALEFRPMWFHPCGQDGGAVRDAFLILPPQSIYAPTTWSRHPHSGEGHLRSDIGLAGHSGRLCTKVAQFSALSAPPPSPWPAGSPMKHVVSAPHFSVRPLKVARNLGPATSEAADEPHVDSQSFPGVRSAVAARVSPRIQQGKPQTPESARETPSRTGERPERTDTRQTVGQAVCACKTSEQNTAQHSGLPR